MKAFLEVVRMNIADVVSTSGPSAPSCASDAGCPTDLGSVCAGCDDD